MSARLRLRSLVCVALPCVVALLILYLPLPLLGWVAAQFIKSLIPLDLSFVVNSLQHYAWAEWEAEVAGRTLRARELTEVEIGAPPPAGLAKPFVVRGMLNGSRLGGDVEWLRAHPVGSIVVDFFSNASVREGVVPDSRGPLRDVVSRIIAGGPEKIGTERVFRAYPALLEELLGERAPAVASLLGGASHIRQSRIGTTLTVPVFMANGAPRARTDLHAEPIGNLMLMLKGRKRWTLVDPDQSRLLRPTLSPDGRAYFFSAQPTEEPEVSLAHVHRWVGETAEGDALWVPAWTWHRVDYVHEGVLSCSASLFHFRIEQAAMNNGLYSALALPNIVKELVGWKTQ